MKIVGWVQARYTLILGAQEWERKEAILRDMQSQEQRPFSLSGSAETQCEELVGLVQILSEVKA